MSVQYIGTARLQKGQSKAVSGTTATFTNPIGVGVRKFRLSATVDICFVQGPASGLTATVNDSPVYASAPEYFTCMEGESVAVIARDGASTGTAYLEEAV